MKEETLKAISDAMEEIGLNYEFMEWTGNLSYPYFTGEYTEIEPISESGEREASFILDGFARDGPDSMACLELEHAKTKIADYFSPIDGRMVATQTGRAAIFYANSFPVQTGDAALKRIQINLTVKEWSVN